MAEHRSSPSASPAATSVPTTRTRSRPASSEERRHRHWRLPDGSLRYEGQLPPAEGDRFETAISAFHQPDGKDVPDEARRSHAQRCADAMAALAGAALRAGAAGDVGGVRPHVSVVVPIEAMASLQDAEAAGVTAVTEHGTVLSMAAFRKLACDARVRRIVIGPGSEAVDVGRATRQWPAPMRAAIMAIDGGCRGPGCDLPPHRCIVHHVRWWESGGETSVANGAPLCDRHHDLVHDDGWTLDLDPVSRTCTCTWTSPEGTVIETQPWGATPSSRPLLGHASGDQPAPPGAPQGAATTDDRVAAPATTATDRPSGRGDPDRPPGPGSDPPRGVVEDRAPPGAGAAEPLQLGL